MKQKINTTTLLNTAQAAHHLGLKNPNTLNVWRATKRYIIPYVKVGRLVRYRLEDIDAFLRERTIGKINKEENAE